jgi:hypothetical protein
MLADKYDCESLNRNAWLAFRNPSMIKKDISAKDSMEQCEEFVEFLTYAYDIDSPENARELLVLSILKVKTRKILWERINLYRF